jgi:hypothetical protein
MDASVEVASDSGALLIIDSSQLADMSENVRYWFGVFTDPDGTTQIVADFDEPWSQVWRRAGAEMASFASSGRFIVIKSAPGRYFIRIAFEAVIETPIPRVYESALAHVTVRTGRLAVSDGTNKPTVVSVPAGEYQAAVHTLSVDRKQPQIVGIYGGAENPAILIALRPAPENGPNTSLVRCSTAAFPSEPAAGLLCRAQVKRVEEGIAILGLQIADRTWSGYGRLRVTPGASPIAGATLLVRLTEHTGSWWWCELPIPAA